MATFTTDPRIAYAQGMRKNYLQRALSPIQLPQNPYGGSPLASALQRVTEGYLAGQEGRRAAELQKAQSSAQNQILSGLLKAGSARTGQLSQRQVPLPGPDYAMTRTEYSIGDDGAQIPTIDPTVLKAAGIEPAAYQVALASAKAQGDKLTQARLERDINRELSSVLSQENPDMNLARQLQALVDPSKALASKEKRLAAGARKSSPKQWEANLESLRRTYDLTEQQLGDIVFGRLRPFSDPLTGAVSLINISTNEIIPLTEKAPASQAAKAPDSQDANGKTAPQGLFSRLQDGPPVTGLVPAVQMMAEEVGSQLEPVIPGIAGSIAEKGQLALRTELNLTVKELKLALAKNPKYAIGEQDEIEKRLNIDASLAVGTPALLERIRGAGRYLRKKLKEEIRNKNDKSLPPEARRMAAGSARAIEDFLRKMSVPKSVEDMTDAELQKIIGKKG